MSNNLRKQLKLMSVYNNTECKKLKKSLMEELTKDDKCFLALREIITNILFNNIKVPESTRKTLKKTPYYLIIFIKILKVNSNEKN